MFELLPGYNATPMTKLAMQLPMFTHGSPFAIDWNDDGVLDLWHHNHYSFSGDLKRWSDPSTNRKGPDSTPGGCMIDWDALIRDGKTGEYSGPNDRHGFISWSDREKDKCFDVHSSTFLDIDGDGYKDLFLTTGGGRGLGDSSEFNNLLFWGEPSNSTLGFRLDGGRKAAKRAGLEGRNSRGNERGRHQYWMDVDGDGRLDVVTLTEENLKGSVVPGKLYRNIDGRHFEEVEREAKDFAEFAEMAMLTDIDGDGYAREFIVPSNCEPRDTKDSPRQNYVCNRAPRGSIGIYRYDPEHLLFREGTTPPVRDFDSIQSVATGDFDEDGIADIVILWFKQVHFHLSTTRKERCKRMPGAKNKRNCLFSLDKPNYVLDLRDTCGDFGAAGVRLADFDLNGRTDMLVICKSPGRHRIFEQVSKRSWRTLRDKYGNRAHFGTLNDPDLTLGGSNFCSGIPVSTDPKVSSLKPCEEVFKAKDCKRVRYKHQFIICNMRAKKPGVSIARAFGPTVADIDNDGYPDIILGYKFGSTVIVRNTYGDNARNNFLAVRLDRRAGAAETVGAVVQLKTDQMGPYSNETITQLRVVSSLSHGTDANGGAEDRLVFGLGRRGRIIKLVVRWPHCCKPTIISGKDARLFDWKNSMVRPYEVPPPKGCDRSCWLPPSSK